MSTRYRVDPFVFVAAERYAIRRWLTSASEIIAAEIVAHKDVVCSDMGARNAILKDIEDMLRDSDPDSTVGLRSEWEANRERWRGVATALNQTPERRIDG